MSFADENVFSQMYKQYIEQTEISDERSGYNDVVVLPLGLKASGLFGSGGPATSNEPKASAWLQSKSAAV